MGWIWPRSHSLLTPILEDETHGIELSCPSNPSLDHLESPKFQPIPRYARQQDTRPRESLSQPVAHSRHMYEPSQHQPNPAESFAKPLSHG